MQQFQAYGKLKNMTVTTGRLAGRQRRSIMLQSLVAQAYEPTIVASGALLWTVLKLRSCFRLFVCKEALYVRQLLHV